LDRSEGLRLDEIPNVVAEGLIFGKQTDREARVELYVPRTELEAAREALAQVAGELVSLPGREQEVVEQISREALAMSWNWHLPPEVSSEERRRLDAEKRQQMVMEVWPQVPRAELDGKTPAEAAGDPELALPLEAALLALEVEDGESEGVVDLTPLYE